MKTNELRIKEWQNEIILIPILTSLVILIKIYKKVLQPNGMAR